MAAHLSRADKRKQALAVLDEVTRGINHLSVPVIAKIRPVLRQAQRELEDQLREWLSREQGATTFTAQRYRNALLAVRRADETIQHIQPTTEDALWVGADTAGHLATAHLHRELVQFGHIFEGTIQPIALDQAAIIARGDKVLFKQFESSAAKYADSIGDSVINELAVSRVKSETIFELTNRLERRLPHVFQGQRYDAERLARTETLSAYSQYHYEGLKDIHADDETIVARWDASYDSRRCPACASLDGQVKNVAKGEKFEAEWWTFRKRSGKATHHYRSVEKPPLHPNCFPAGTPVLTSTGWRAIDTIVAGDLVIGHDGDAHPVARQIRSQFSGHLVTLRAGEKVVHATPNHPMAGEDRWVRADRLDVAGDRLWVLEGGLPVTNDRPPAGENQRLVGRVLNHLAAPGMPTSAVQLDVQHEVGKPDVGVEPFDRKVVNEADAKSIKSQSHRLLIRPVRAALARLRLGFHLLLAHLSPAYGAVGSVGLGSNLIWRHRGIASDVVLRQRAQSPGRFQDPGDRNAAATEPLRQRDGGFARAVEANHLEFIQRQSPGARLDSPLGQGSQDRILAALETTRDGVRGLSSDVEADDFILGQADALVSHGFVLRHIDSSTTQTRPFAGVVFNLEVAGAHTYIAGGFLTHNCRCVITPWRADWEDFARARTPADPHALKVREAVAVA